jgi:DNA polymerase-3 subunit epsilon
MTGGQTTFQLGSDSGAESEGHTSATLQRLPSDRPRLRVIRATEAEIEAHHRALDGIAEAAGGKDLWRGLGLEGSEPA